MNMTIAVMAAGMGSRYGGLKQIDRFGEGGEILMEYGIYDALKAGFNRVIVILNNEILNDFREACGDRLSKRVQVDYAFQRLDDVPSWFVVPKGRVKPWGTTQAIAALDGIVNEPFCIINADDFYGGESFSLVADFLKNSQSATPYECCMAGYAVENTLSENGCVTRGVCEVDAAGRLARLVERYKIRRHDDGVIRDEATGAIIHEGTSVSMNMFGFQSALPTLLKERFHKFLKTGDVAKGECIVPAEISSLVYETAVTVDVLPTTATWQGVTYIEDKAPLIRNIRDMITSGVYPKNLWRG